MKKICCLLMACMMILTGFSIPTFAMEGNTEDVQGAYNIANIPEDRIMALRKKVDYVCKLAIHGELKTDSGEFFDALCIADLISKYYANKGQVNEYKEYVAKRYLCAAGLIVSSESNIDNFFNQFKLSIYCLDTAFTILSSLSNRDPNYYEGIEEDTFDLYASVLMPEKYRRAYVKILEAREARGEIITEEDIKGEVLEYGKGHELAEEYPKNEEEFEKVLNEAGTLFNGYNFKLFENNCILKNVENNLESADKLYSENHMCKLRVGKEDEGYKLGDVLSAVLSGCFDFGPGGVHIGFGALINN